MNEYENNKTMENNIKLEVNTRPAQSTKNPHVLGYATVKIGDLMYIKNIQIVQSESGPFVSMPSVKNREGNFQPVCFPSKEFRPILDKAVLNTFSPREEAYQKFQPDKGRANFEIKVTPYDKDGIKGFIQLKIPDVMYFNNVSVRENENGNLWVSMPGYAYTNSDGEKAYHSFFEPLKKNESLIYGSIINAYKDSILKEQISKNIQNDKTAFEKEISQNNEKTKPELKPQQNSVEQINILHQKYPTRAKNDIEI